MAQTIFTWLLLLLPAPSSPSEFARYATIAQAIEYAAADVQPNWPGSPLALRAALVVIVDQESNGMLSVHTGERRGPHGEWGLPQLHPAAERYLARFGLGFADVVGTDIEHTTNAMRIAGKLLASHRSRCRARHYRTNADAAMFTAYHFGGRCWLSPHARKRARLLQRLLREVEHVPLAPSAGLGYYTEDKS